MLILWWQRLERGENMEDDDGFGKGSGEARDDISMLPRKVAIKVCLCAFVEQLNPWERFYCLVVVVLDCPCWHSKVFRPYINL